MTNNYYYITTGQGRHKEIYDMANEVSHTYYESGNKLYVLRHTYEDYNGTVKDYHIKNLSRDIEIAKTLAKNWVVEKGDDTSPLNLKDSYPKLDDYESKPQWVKDIEESNQIEKDKRKELKKKWDAEREQRELERAEKHKKILSELSKSNYVGQPKDRLEKKLTVTYFKCKEIDPYCYGASSYVNIITLVDEEKNIYSYIGSSDLGIDEELVGKTLNIKFTVKKHALYTPKFARNYHDFNEGEYTRKYDFEGAKQTVIQRPKVIN